MARNLMPEVAKMLGVELGEKFIIQNTDRKETVVLALDGFHVIQPNDVLGPDHGKLLSKVLQGFYEVKKLPWEPKKGDVFYYPDPTEVDGLICEGHWGECVPYLALKALGMIYRTREEAQTHLAEDYERLTGKPLSSR